MGSWWCLYCELYIYFTPCSSVSIVNSEQLNTGWEAFLQEVNLSSKFVKVYYCNFTCTFSSGFNLGFSEKYWSMRESASMVENAVLNLVCFAVVVLVLCAGSF